MDCKQKLDLKLYFMKPEFFIDEFISGNLLLRSARPSIIEKIVFEINVVQGWNIDGKSPTKFIQNICSFNLKLEKSETMSKIEDCYVMPSGNNIIPFNFKFKNDILPSFEFPLGDKHAYIRYLLKINIYSSSFHKLVWNHYIFFKSRPFINLNEQLLYKTIDKTIKKWNLIGKGTTVMRVDIPENNFKVDSTLKVKVSVDNIYGKEPTKEVKIKFKRIIDFYGKKQEIKFNDETLIFSKVIPIIVLPGQKNDIECEFPVREKDVSRYKYNKKFLNPYDLKLENINYYMPTVFCKLFSCKYELKVGLYFKSRVGKNDRPRARFPINLAHQTTLENQMEMQKQIEEEIKKKKEEEEEKEEKEKKKEKEEKEEKENERKNNDEAKDINNEKYNEKIKEIRELRMSFIKSFEEEEEEEDEYNSGNKNNNNINKGKINVNNILNNNMHDYEGNIFNDVKDKNDDDFPQLHDIEIGHQNNQILQGFNYMNSNYQQQFKYGLNNNMLNNYGNNNYNVIVNEGENIPKPPNFDVFMKNVLNNKPNNMKRKEDSVSGNNNMYPTFDDINY